VTASPYATRDPVDFIVVGRGAAGGVVAAELASSGFSIVLLEQGPRLQEKDFTHDEFGVIDQSAIANRQTLQPTTFRESEHQPARLKRAVDYCRVVGGGSVHFTANYCDSTNSTLQRAAGGEMFQKLHWRTGPSAIRISSRIIPGQSRNSECQAKPGQTHSTHRDPPRTRCHHCP